MALNKKKEKSEATLAQEVQEEYDRKVAQRRKDDEWNNDSQEFAKEHNLDCVDDHKTYIRAVLSKSKMLSGGKKDSAGDIIPKKRCIECGSTNIQRQYDKTKTKLGGEIFWIDEYICRDCKTKMIL